MKGIKGAIKAKSSDLDNETALTALAHWEKRIDKVAATASTTAGQAYLVSHLANAGPLNKSFMRRGEAEYKNNMKHVNARERLRAKLEKRKK